MPITRTQFKEISAIRNNISGKVKLEGIKTELTITSIREVSINDSENSVIVFEYSFKTPYSLSDPKDQELGSIKVDGEIFYVDKTSIIKEIISEWESKKKIKTELLQEVVNTALSESQPEAIMLAKKIGLPSPIPLPRLKAKVVKESAS